MTKTKTAATPRSLMGTGDPPCWEDNFRGTGVIYLVGCDGSDDFVIGDYEIDLTRETSKNQLRAEWLRRKRKNNGGENLPAESLGDRVLIAFGPQVSAKQAITALLQVIAGIVSRGLLIGYDAHKNILWECTDGANEV